MSTFRLFFLTILFLLEISDILAKQDESGRGDLSQYTLFNPLPDKYLGPMKTDRPDITDIPYTVAPGHLQVEFDMVFLVWDHTKLDGYNIKARSFTILDPNFRIGLLHNLEMDILFNGYTDQTIKDLKTGSKKRQNGMNDLILRFKYNFWGNDGKGKTAFGIIPMIKFPTNQHHLGNKFYEGGVLFPLDIIFIDKVSLGLMTGAKYVRAINHHKYVYSFPNTASLSIQLTEKLGSYIEIASEKSTEKKSPWYVTLDIGTTYGVTSNFQLDAGVDIGLSKAANDICPFIGIAVRI